MKVKKKTGLHGSHAEIYRFDYSGSSGVTDNEPTSK